MAELICTLCKLLQGARVALTQIPKINPPKIIRTPKKTLYGPYCKVIWNTAGLVVFFADILVMPYFLLWFESSIAITTITIIIIIIIIIIVSEALFCLCRGTNIYNFWGVTEFQVKSPRDSKEDSGDGNP